MTKQCFQNMTQDEHTLNTQVTPVIMTQMEQAYSQSFMMPTMKELLDEDENGQICEKQEGHIEHELAKDCLSQLSCSSVATA